jgi:hypothetical protein
MSRRFVVLALAGGAALAALLASRRRSLPGDPSRNGGSQERATRLRREFDEARGRLRNDIARAHEQQ